MSLRLEMLQAARLSPQILGESAELVVDFLQSQLSADGGFCDRDGKSDLYYTTFGIGGLLALHTPLPVDRLLAYLRSIENVEELTLVDAGCLARCWAAMAATDRDERLEQRIINRVEEFRTPDGGYGEQAEHGTVYGCFLALGAYEDMGRQLPNAGGMLACIERLRTPGGAYANGEDVSLGLTTPTAAAVALLRRLGELPDAMIKDWLLARLHPQGGFCVADGLPMPDLLSTATALHALDSLHVDLQPIKELCLDFIDSLWTARGGFYGSWEDDALDVEYTYYGLLSLGHLCL